MLGNIVSIPARNLHDNLARLDDLALAAQPRMKLRISCFIELVRLVVFHRAEQLFTALDYHMARRTSTMPSASVVESDPEVQSNVEN